MTEKRKIFTSQNVSAIGRGIETGANVSAKLFNKGMAKENEWFAKFYGRDAYQKTYRKSRRVIGQQIANVGASGLQRMGSVAQVIEQSMMEAGEEAAAAKWQYDMQAIQLDNQQNLERTGALTTLAGGLLRDKAYKISESKDA